MRYGLDLDWRRTAGCTLLIAMFAASALCTNACAQNRTVRTASGLVEGIASAHPGVNAFLGMPYAAAPVGELRWRPPQPVAAWKGVRKADHFSASCMQHISGSRLPWTPPFMAQLPISEDCLYLNVWTPEIKTKSPKAVLLWIHGGGFTEGAASATIFNGANLASEGIVVVSINYRLGLMGFFALPELTRESPHHASGNYGLLDMVAALQWVHENIRAFGGDPDKVTVDGQSAGAWAVQFLTASPLARGLFRGAIIESGAHLGNPVIKNLSGQQQMGTALEEFAKLRTLKDLRALSAVEVQAFDSKAHLKFIPDIDGWFLPEGIDAIFAAGQENDVPTINGMVADEGSSHHGYGELTPAEFQAQIHTDYRSFADAFLRLYPSNTQAECTESQKQLSRDKGLASMYLWGVLRAQTSRTPAYTFEFTHVLPWPEHPEFGAFHESEVPYWMRNLDLLDRPFTAEDRKISNTLSAYWVNFVKTGSPNGKGVPVWPALATTAATTMDLGGRMVMRPIMSQEKFDLWVKRDHAGALLGDAFSGADAANAIQKTP